MSLASWMKQTIVVAWLLVAVACAEAPATERAAPSASASSSAPSFTGQVNEQLALSDPGGSEPVDIVIRAYQANIAKLQRNDDWILLGRAWIRKARETVDPTYYLHAKMCAEQVLASQPDDVLALGLIGQVQINDHQFEKALATADGVLARVADDLPSLTNASDALLELGRYDEARKVTDKLVSLKPALGGYARSSYLSWLHGQEENARESGRLAIESAKDPSDPEPRCYSLVHVAHIFWHKGDYSGANAGYSKALAECPDFHLALGGRGRVALALGNTADAVDAFERARKKTPSIEVLWRLGDAKVAAGDEAAAEKVYKELVERGKQTDRRTTAQFLAVKNRDVDLAVRLARAEMLERPGIYTEDALAWALFRQCDGSTSGRQVPGRTCELEEAHKLSQRALRLGTPDASLEYHAGAILIAKGDKDAGKKLIEQALQRNPKFDPTGADEARKLLDTQ